MRRSWCPGWACVDVLKMWMYLCCKRAGIGIEKESVLVLKWRWIGVEHESVFGSEMRVYVCWKWVCMTGDRQSGALKVKVQGNPVCKNCESCEQMKTKTKNEKMRKMRKMRKREQCRVCLIRAFVLFVAFVTCFAFFAFSHFRIFRIFAFFACFVNTDRHFFRTPIDNLSEPR